MCQYFCSNVIPNYKENADAEVSHIDDNWSVKSKKHSNRFCIFFSVFSPAGLYLYVIVFKWFPMKQPSIGICDWILIVDQTTGLLTLQLSQWELLAECNPTLIYFFFLSALLHFAHLYILAEI